MMLLIWRHWNNVRVEGGFSPSLLTKTNFPRCDQIICTNKIMHHYFRLLHENVYSCCRQQLSNKTSNGEVRTSFESRFTRSSHQQYCWPEKNDDCWMNSSTKNKAIFPASSSTNPWLNHVCCFFSFFVSFPLLYYWWAARRTTNVFLGHHDIRSLLPS